jgi:SAM-dependent methyltransferase
VQEEKKAFEIGSITQYSKLFQNTEAKDRILLNIGATSPPRTDLSQVIGKVTSVDIQGNPDILDDIRTLETIPDDSYDMFWASHCLEHVYFHEHHLCIKNWKRILKPGGVGIIAVPDLQYVFETGVTSGLHGEAYKINGVSYSLFEMLYGAKQEIPKNVYMAHKSGFDSKALENLVDKHKFEHWMVVRQGHPFCALVAVVLKPNIY